MIPFAFTINTYNYAEPIKNGGALVKTNKWDVKMVVINVPMAPDDGYHNEPLPVAVRILTRATTAESLRL